MKCDSAAPAKSPELASREDTGPGASRVAPWAAAVLALAATSAQAVLGEALPSRAQAEAAGGAVQRVTALSSGVRVQELVRPDGSAVKEFAGADGIVFAIAWHTRLKPDLHQLLGRHGGDYAAAASDEMRQRPGLRRSVALQRGDLLVHSSGHLDAFVGRAVLLSRLPGSLRVDEIR